MTRSRPANGGGVGYSYNLELRRQEGQHMERPNWAPEGVDTERPSAARVYDYALGGSHNFAVDRELFRKLIETVPDLAAQARASRAFLRRAVRFCVAQGVSQFLDIGAGIPTRGNVHEIAPDARVMYVDTDPVAVAHSRAILAGNERVGVLQEDFCRPEGILGHPDVCRLLDLDQPVAVLLVAMLHLIPDEDDPAGIIARLRDGIAPGSYLVISHGTAESRPEVATEGVQVLQRGRVGATLRTREQVQRMFTGFELVEPGIVWIPQWHPDEPAGAGDDPEQSIMIAGVGRKT
jgi:SAM-dependent methyltransferase